MENEMNRQLSVKRFDSVHTTDVSEDFSLPDYIPEVRRVVGVQSSSTVDGKYLNGDELEADGSVMYTVIYLGGDGGLCAVPLSSSYDTRIPVKSADGDIFGVDDISLSSSPENVTCRVTAPRRLTLSSKVKLRLFSQRSVDCGEKIEPAELTQSVKLKKGKAGYASVTSLRYNGECGGEIREREGTKVISAQGSININEAKSVPDGIAVSGEARAAMLLLTPDGVYTTAKGRSAVDVVIPCDTGGLLSAAAYGRCLMCEIEAADDGLITWNIEYDIDCDGVKGGESEISVDGYSPDYADECTFADAAALSFVKGVNGRLSVSGSRQIRPGMSCAGGWGRVVFERAEFAQADRGSERGGGRMVISGNAYITVILCGDGEAVSEECVIPVRYECEVDSGSAGGDLMGKCEITVFDVSGRCDGETLNVTAELAINGVFLAENGVHYLSRMNLDTAAPVSRKKNVIKICVPDKSEEEWDIMKRYRVEDSVPKKAGKVYIV